MCHRCRARNLSRAALGGEEDEVGLGTNTNAVGDGTEPQLVSERRRNLRGRIAVLRASIARQRREIDTLEAELRHLADLGVDIGAAESPPPSLFDRLFRSGGVFVERALKYGDPISFVYDQTGTALRVASETAASGELLRDVLPNAPTLLTFAPGLYARATQLDAFLPGILPVLDGYLPLVEPHLETIIERFDDLEPHVPFCLENADVIAPNLGFLLNHLDEILAFASEKDIWEEMEPVLRFLATRIETLGPHLPLLYPHRHYLRPYLAKLARHVDRLTPHLAISRHADVILDWFGWLLHFPGLHHFLSLRGIPFLLAWLAPRLPRRGGSRQYKYTSRRPRQEERRPPARLSSSFTAATFYVLQALWAVQEEEARGKLVAEFRRRVRRGGPT